MIDYLLKEDILEVFTELSYSQGFYGRLLRDMTEETLEYLEGQKFHDILDLIMFIEG